MTIENTYIVDRNLKTVVDQLEEIKELLDGGDIPIATADTLGGVKVGSGLSITEQGVLSASSGSGVLIVNANENGVLDKTWQEIYDAGFSILHFNGSQELQIYCDYESGEYNVDYWTPPMDNPHNFVTNSATGYPTISI